MNDTYALNPELRLAEVCFRAQDYGSAMAYSRAFLAKFPMSRGTSFARASYVLSASLLYLGRPEEALQISEDALDSGQSFLDLYYVCTLASGRLGRDERVLEYGERYHKIYEELKGAKPTLDALSTSLSPAYEVYNSVGLALLHKDQAERATEWFSRAIEVKGHYLDAIFNLAAAYDRIGRYSKAAEVLRGGIAHHPEDADLHLALGKMLFRMNRFGEARTEYLKAIELNPDLADAYCSLGVASYALADLEEARRWFQRTLEIEPCHAIAREALDALSREDQAGVDPTLSVCMIVKNEERFLARCLESVKDVADELIVVDTGSTDRTVEIAKSFGARVYYHPWNNDFSEARNYSIRYATKGWILWIDADEELEREDVPLLRQMLRGTDYGAIFAAMHDMNVDVRKLEAIFYSPKIFRRREDIYFEGIVHNQVKIPRDVRATNIRIYHYGYKLDKKTMEAKQERSTGLLERQLVERPDDPAVHFNMAQMMLVRRKLEECVYHARKVIELAPPEDIHHAHLRLMSHYQLAQAFLLLGRMDEAEEACLNGLEMKEDYIDLLLILGRMYSTQGRYVDAIDTLNKFLACRTVMLERPVFSLLLIEKLEKLSEAYYLLGTAYAGEKDLTTAERYQREALSEDQDFWPAREALGKILFEQGRFEESAEAFAKLVDSGQRSALNLLNLGKAWSDAGRTSEALSAFEEALSVDDRCGEAYQLKGEVLFSQGKFEEAASALRQGMELGAYTMQSLTMLTDAYLNSGRSDELDALCDQILEGTREPVPDFLLIVANAYAASGSRSKAIGLCERVVASNDEDHRFHVLMGNLYAQEGTVDRARACFERARLLMPGMAEIHRALGVLNIKLGDFEEALRNFSAVSELQPEDVDAKRKLAALYLKTGDVTSAMQYLAVSKRHRSLD